jgi:internalin A
MASRERIQITQKLHELTVQAFDENELSEVVYFTLGKQLADLIALNANFRSTVLRLIAWADKDGCLNQLARALAQQKPNRRDLADVVDQLDRVVAPPVLPAGEVPEVAAIVLTAPAATNEPATPATAISPSAAASAPAAPSVPLAISESTVATANIRAAVSAVAAVTGGSGAGFAPATSAAPAMVNPLGPTEPLTVFLAAPPPDSRGQNDHRAVADALRQLKKVTVQIVPESVSRPEFFVSFAWGGDQSPADIERQQAVDRLCTKLPEWGYQVRRDCQEIRFGESISEYMKRLGSSDRVLVILSEKYLRSPFCMTELHYIYQRSLGAEDEFRKRIVPVALADAHFSTPEERLEHAKHWQSRREKLKADWELLGSSDQRLLKEMQRWSQDVGDMLAYINDRLIPRSFDDIGRDDFRALREMLPAPQTVPQLEADLARSQLFVQVLGESGSTAQPEAPQGIERLQFARARAKGLPCLRWRPRDLNMDAIKRANPAYHEYLSGALDPPALDYEERIQAGYLSDFQRAVEQTLDKLDARRRSRFPIHKTAVLFRTHATDQALSCELDQRLRQRTQAICQVVDEYYALGEVYKNERGLVVIHGECSANWVEQHVEELCDIWLAHETNPPICAVFVGPPDGKPPLRKRPPQFHLIRYNDQPAFDRFLAAIQGRNGAAL